MPEKLLTLESDDLRVVLAERGAAIASVSVRDGDGRSIDVALPPENFADGAPDPSLAGRTVGPCCGRVAGGAIEIDGKPLALTRNEGENHLHGGINGVATQAWRGEQLSPTRARFELALPDGLDGYPGNRRLRAEYALSGRTLSVRYTAATDRTTWLGLTNHAYWDLTGRFDGSALDQRLQVAARRVVLNGPGHLPSRAAAAEGPFALDGSRSLRTMLEAFPDHPQLTLGRGYNNAFLLDGALMDRLGFAARLTAPDGGLSLTLRTDQPALVLYSGGFLDGATRLARGGATPGCAVALEAQPVPDPFHLPGQKAELLRPGEEYRREIRWAF